MGSGLSRPSPTCLPRKQFLEDLGIIYHESTDDRKIMWNVTLPD